MARAAQTTTAGRSATWDDLGDVPEGYVGEIIAGELVVSPRPDLPHAQTTSDLGVLLGGPFRFGVGGPGGWVIVDEPRGRFGDDILVPDLAGWRRERWVNPPRQGPIPIIPDWICEVLSCSTEARDRTTKLALYGAHGVKHVWLLSPVACTLEVFRLESLGWFRVAAHAKDEVVRAEPFDAVELNLGLLWPESVEPEQEG